MSLKWTSNKFSDRGFLSPELQKIFEIAIPIVISQASYAVMLFADRLMLSRVGKDELSASMSGGVTTFVLTSFFVGLVGYATALVSQYYGADQRKRCTRATTQALYLTLISYPILLAFLPVMHHVFEIAGQDAALAELANTYARLLLLGSGIVIARTALGSFFIGIGKTNVVMYTNASGVAVSILLNYLLIFGKLGLPEMGIAGAALGTIGGSIFTGAALLWLYLRETQRDEFRVDEPFRFDRDIMGRLLRFGLPTGFEPFLNFFAFNIFLQLMHSYGTDVAASATMAFNWDAMTFIPLVGLSTAATTIGGQHLGAGDPNQARDSVNLTIRLAFGYGLFMAFAYIVFAEGLIAIFASGFEDPDGQITGMSVIMLRMMAISTLLTAYKLTQNGLLRAAGDTVWIMWVSIAIHWAMAVVAILIVKVFELHPYVAWSTMIAMHLAHAAAVYYRTQTNIWREKNLIG